MRLQLAGNKIAVAILLLLKIYRNCVTAELTCHECHGINCLRTSYNATQKCMNDLDICVTVFEQQTVLYQGCLEQLSQVLRNKCNPNVEEVNDQQNSLKLSECFKCNGNLCNNLASETFKCIQCDSNSDTDCRSKSENIIPKKCMISRSPNEYCFAKREGERIVRGCTYTLEEQTACLSSKDCMICQPSEISNCNTMTLIDGSGSAGSDNGVNGSSEGSEGGSANGGSDGSGNDSNGGGSSANGGNDGNDHSGGESSANGGNDGNDSNGGGSSESDGGSVNGGSESDDSGNTSSENGSSGSGSDNSQGSTSGVASNASITIVKIYIWIFTIFLIFSVKF